MGGGSVWTFYRFRGEGVWTFCRFREEGLARKRGGVVFAGGDTPMHTMLKDSRC